MARTAYVTITGSKQGHIKGEVTAKGREGSIPLIALASQIAAPFDQASGAVTGKRQHRPIVITKPLDQATPKLYDALIKNEVLTAVTIKFWRPSASLPGGPEQQYFTVELTNAHITEIEFVSADNQDPTKAAEVPYESLQLVYQKISWTWVEGGFVAEDNWATPP
jgi:type VI secretion system secreted protein Hcp